MKESKIILFLLFIALYSCNKDEAKLKITDFSETRTITLEPYKLIKK